MIGCLQATNFIYSGALAAYTQIINNLNIYGGLIAIDIALNPVYHLADINYSCFVGGEEAYAQILKYTIIIYNPMTVIMNVAYNFGLIYNSIKDIAMYFVYPDRSGAKDPGDLGV